MGDENIDENLQMYSISRHRALMQFAFFSSSLERLKLLSVDSLMLEI